MQVDLREFRAAYLAEVDEHLSAINAGLLAVEAANRAGRASPRELRELMRLLHTVKGLSAMVGVEPVVGIAHRMETVLRAADEAGGVLSDRALEALLGGTRAIEAGVRAVADDAPVPEASARTLADLDAAEAAPAVAARAPAPEAAIEPQIAAKLSASEREQLAQGAAAGRHAVCVEFAPSLVKAERGLTITTLRERLAPLGELVRVFALTREAAATEAGGLVFVLLLVTDASVEAVAVAAAVPERDVREVLAARLLSSKPEGGALPSLPGALASDVDEAPGVADVQRPGVLRVDVARIDDTIDKLAGLIVTRSRLTRAVARMREAGIDTRELDAIMVDKGRQLRDLRAAILRVRMIPIATVLDRLPLVIRGLGRTTGKEVRLLLEGAAAELDKTVADRLFPALVHLMRNAVDHGIESPEERERAGKPARATITVSSSSRDNRQIEVRIADDGRGVDRARVAEKAGRDVPETDRELLDLLCRPGLSTRDIVNATSGRGVGMDIVREIVVDGLGGELAMETVTGRGTAFIIRVPLTIAIVDAFTLRCAGERFVVPVPVVEEIVEIARAKIFEGPYAGGRPARFFMRRGETIPLIDLAQVLGLASAEGHANDGPRDQQALVVRRGHDDAVGFVIDRVLGQQETVVRPLVDRLVTVAGVSGSTDLGDGRATLVLDLLGLSAKLGREREDAA